MLGRIWYFSKFSFTFKNQIMPKKFRKNKQKSVPIYKNILTIDSKEHADVLRGLCEMFPNLDASVIQLIVDESENNVEQALETLISLSNSDKISVKEDEKKLIKEIPNDEKIEFSTISKIFQKSLNIDPDSNASYDAFAAGSSSYNSTDCISNPLENFKNIQPQFIVPSVPMHGSPSPHKFADLDANKAFWNVSDSKCFSTCASKDNITDSSVKQTIEKIKNCNQVLIILRGLPGSGKSSLALKLKFSGVIFSTDDFFMRAGTYVYDCTLLSEAHAWNQHRTKKALQKGITPVIIDNTNVEAWEMKPYVSMGKAYNYEIIILEPDTPWKFDLRELAQRNKHGVSKSKIAKMKERYAKNITVESILPSRRLFSTVSTVNEDILNEDSNSFSTVNEGYLNKDSDSFKQDEKHDKIPTNINNFEENRISLEAIIHREDNSFDEKCSINNNLQPSVHDFCVPESSICNEPITVSNLEELRTLTGNDSEDSHSSINSSLQEISGWEAITEPDESFKWSTSSEDLKHNVKSSSIDNLSIKESTDPLSSQDNTSSLNTSVENLTSSGDDSSVVLDKLKSTFKSDETDLDSYLEISNSENISKNVTLGTEKNKPVVLEENKLKLTEINLGSEEGLWPDSKLVDNNEVSHSSIVQTELITSSKNSVVHIRGDEKMEITDDTNKNLNFQPKPCRNNDITLLTLPKSYFIDQPFQENVQSPEVFSLQWDIQDDKVEDKTDNLFADNQSKTEIHSTPKPQRSAFQGKYSEKKNNIKNKYILNISLDADWKFPEYIQDDTHNTTTISKKSLSFKMSAHSQTETRDFDLMHQIAVGNSGLDCCNYRILQARPNNDNYAEDFNSKPSNDFETTSYLEAASYDKSTCTDDLVDSVEISQKLSYLQECFPDISIEDLRHHLEMCHNNERWLSNLLLDWGYKYNVPERSFRNSSNEELNSDENDFAYQKIFSGSAKKKYSQTSVKNNCFNSSSDVDDSSSSTSNNITEMPKETELKLGKGSKTIPLILDPAFARKLEELFGPVANSAKRCVYVDMEIAELIYRKWKSTANDSAQDVKTGKKFKFKKKLKYTPPKVNKEPSPFSEIMDQELALKLHKEEKLRKDDDFETKLKRMELYNMFPGADTVVLDEIFESNNCSLKDSLEALGEGEKETRKDEFIEKRKVADKIEKDISSWKKLQIFQEFETGNWNDWVYKEDSNSSGKESAPPSATSAMPSEAAALREEASEQYQIRLEYINKARRAFDNGMNDVASFYAQQGREHGKKSKKANQEAAVLIAQARNSSMQCDCLDLHSLYTKEAITLLDKFLKEKKGEMRRNKRKLPLVVSVITGIGKHSIQGPKIQPAVENFLRSNGYKYSENQSGKLDVTILPE